jgi:hypothetical protein
MTGLNPQHRNDLLRSGLNDVTIAQSNIYSGTVDDIADVLDRKDLGAGMIIPYPTLHGSARFARVKPDHPPHNNGRPAKYLTAKGAGNRLYIPAGVEDALILDTPLLITEGEKKALKATQEGFACVALAGVWCFRQKDAASGLSQPLPEFDRILWSKRSVFIVFDSDLADKPAVQQAERALAEELEGRGAVVRIVRLPDGPEGQKVGLDDFLVLHGSDGPARLRALMDQAPSPVMEYGVYRIEDGRMGWMRTIGRGEDATEHFTSLCNFVARVVEEKVLDNGAEVQRKFTIALSIAGTLPPLRFDVTVAQFTSMSWVVREGGIRARIAAGQGSQDRLRECIQTFSGDAKSRYAYAHTGWRRIREEWTYLHAGRCDLEVVLDGKLDRYRLPNCPTETREAIQCSLGLLDVAPHEVTIPLLASVYLAPLCEWLHPDFVLFLVGPSGTRKSSLAALFLSHYGDFANKADLPGSWESTDNALEKLLFTLKDVLACVDDYAPRADLGAQRRQAGRAQRIIRSAGNISGRGRMNPDGTLRPEYPPRGLLLSTGEDLPPGQSILARTLSVDIGQGVIDLPRLTQAQTHAHRLPHALADYIQWLTPQVVTIKDELITQFTTLRNRFSSHTAHGRLPEILSYLGVGINLLVVYAKDRGALTDDEGEQLILSTFGALRRLGTAHGERIGEANPAQIFLSTLAAVLASGIGYLQHRNRPHDMEDREIIGWKDEQYAYLIPDAATRAVSRFLRDSDRHFPYSNQALYKALSEEGVLVPGSDGKSTRSVTIDHKKRRVLTIPLVHVESVVGDEHPLDEE